MKNNRPALTHKRFRPALEVLESRDLLAVFSVTNLNDVGAGSLRAGLTDLASAPIGEA